LARFFGSLGVKTFFFFISVAPPAFKSQLDRFERTDNAAVAAPAAAH
jgi:hypothetical protein